MASTVMQISMFCWLPTFNGSSHWLCRILSVLFPLGITEVCDWRQASGGRQQPRYKDPARGDPSNACRKLGLQVHRWTAGKPAYTRRLNTDVLTDRMLMRSPRMTGTHCCTQTHSVTCAQMCACGLGCPIWLAHTHTHSHKAYVGPAGLESNPMRRVSSVSFTLCAILNLLAAAIKRKYPKGKEWPLAFKKEKNKLLGPSKGQCADK